MKLIISIEKRRECFHTTFGFQTKNEEKRMGFELPAETFNPKGEFSLQTRELQNLAKAIQEFLENYEKEAPTADITSSKESETTL